MYHKRKGVYGMTTNDILNDRPAAEKTAGEESIRKPRRKVRRKAGLHAFRQDLTDAIL